MSAAKNLPAKAPASAPSAGSAVDSSRVQKISSGKVNKGKADPVGTRMHSIIADCGAADTLRHTILYFVSLEKYERAKEELRRYIESKSEYPFFKSRALKLREHCYQTIDYIQQQRSTPGILSLSFSRQQDHYEKIVNQFEALRGMLAKMEKMEMEVRLEDVRSTVVLLRAILFCSVGVISIFMFQQLGFSVYPTLLAVFDHYAAEAVNKIFETLGW